MYPSEMHGVFSQCDIRTCRGEIRQKARQAVPNVPVSRPCGAAGNDEEKLFVHVRGALLMQEALWRMRRHIEIPAPSIA